MADRHVNGNGRRARAVVLWAFAVVVAVLLSTIGLVLAKSAADRRSDAEAACRARIANHAAAIRDDRDTAGWDALAARVLEGQQIDTVARAKQIRDLNEALGEASDLRSHANAICDANPDYQPPP